MRRLLIAQEQVRPARPTRQVEVLADFDEAVGTEDHHASVIAIQPGRREPVHAEVAAREISVTRAATTATDGASDVACGGWSIAFKSPVMTR